MGRPSFALLLGIGLAAFLTGLLPREGCAQNSPVQDSTFHRLPSPEPIAEVRRDADGDAVPDRIGDTVVVAGRALAGPSGLAVPVRGIAALGDSSGGIHTTFSEDAILRRGDSLRVRGVLQHRYGLAQLDVLDHEVVGSARQRVPDPIPLTVPVAAGERYEGELVRVEGQVAEISRNDGGKYLILTEDGSHPDELSQEAAQQIMVFVSSDETSRIRPHRFEAGDQVEVTGLLGQHDYEAPYTSYYQVVPRRETDLARAGLWRYFWPAVYIFLGGGGLAVGGLLYGLRALVRRRTRELKEERDRLETLFESLPMPVIHGQHEEEEPVIRDVNPAFEEVFGYDRREAKGKGLDELIVPPSKEEEANRFNKVALKKGGEGAEVRRQTKNGMRTFRAQVTVREDEGYGIYTDITEQKRQERILQKRREKIEALYAATERLLRASSREEVSTRIHEVLEEVFDYSFVHTGFVEEKTGPGEEDPLEEDPSEEDLIVPEQTEATSGLAIPHPEPRPTDGNTVAASALRARGAVVTQDTGKLDNPIEYGDLCSAAGVPVGERGAIVVGRAQEGGFEQMNLRLLEVLGSYAALVLGRLDREEELLSAKEEAESANRMKSAMLANMSHEIRTPLTGIIGFAEAIGEDQEVAGRFAPLIEKSGKRLLDTLDTVLNLSKLEAGEMELSSGPVDLAGQAEAVAEELRPKAEEKGLELQVCGGRTCAQADEGGVQIVLQNLLSNAVKYTESGRVEARVYRENGAAVIEVEDTGIGMESELADGLFEPFRQASEGISREYEGTGLGLAVTKKAAEEMNASIEVKTQKGEGSCFTVRLPQAEASSEEGD